MKKLTLALCAILLSAGVTFAQTDKLLLDATRKALTEAKKKADESVMKKDSLKSKTWLTRGEAYLDIAISNDSVIMKTEPSSAYKAMANFKKALALDPVSPAKKYLSQVMGKDGKPEPEGQKMYSAFLNGGILKYQAKDYQGSVKDLKMAMEIAPKDTLAANYTGVIGQLAKDDASSKYGFEKYIELGGKDATVIYALAQVYKNENNEEKALGI
jgi:tetratricopeptide (TPR) repeat protein